MKRYITPRPYQIEQANIGYALLKEHGLCYNVSDARVGKSLASLLIFEMSTRLSLLILTKKTALVDWLKLIKKYPIPGKRMEAINYESIHKLPADFTPDIVILDEAHHALSKYPKPSATLLKVADVVWGLPLMYLSMTPHAESYSQIYHQLRLSPWSPFADYKNFYDWHREYGVPAIRYLGSRSVPMYNETKEDVIKPIFDALCYGMTRKEAGFKHEAEDEVHMVELEEPTRDLIQQLKRDKIAFIDVHEVLIENAMSLFQKCYQIEGGTMKVQTGTRATSKRGKDGLPVLKPVYEYYILGNTEKVDYIKNTFGDTTDVVIMYNYQAEEMMLKQHFKHALILQADRYAEGISLKEYKTLVIYSMSFRTSKYIQRRDRQNDYTRDEPITVHYILSDGCISQDVYETVVLKETNFNTRMYETRHGALKRNWKQPKPKGLYNGNT